MGRQISLFLFRDPQALLGPLADFRQGQGSSLALESKSIRTADAMR